MQIRLGPVKAWLLVFNKFQQIRGVCAPWILIHDTTIVTLKDALITTVPDIIVTSDLQGLISTNNFLIFFSFLFYGLRWGSPAQGGFEWLTCRSK